MTDSINRQSAIGNWQFNSLVWAVYLGMSWTWCIGMFLPVLLVRDYGVWGWVVFAIPNVVGAAAMGWVMRAVTPPEALEESHRSALSAFSIVTIAFHWFFLAWIIARLIPGAGFVLLLIVLMYHFASVSSLLLTLVLSVLAWVTYIRYGWTSPLAGEPAGNLNDLFWLAPLCVFGFALNPYLDATFHHAYRAAGPARSRMVFGVGFGVIFFAMIVFTLCYARALEPLASTNTTTLALPRAAMWAIGVHMLAQTSFTVGAHMERLPRRRVLGLLGGLVVAAAVFGVGWLCTRIGVARMTAGETTYRLFMGFYGLVFPAYVWLCMLPTRKNPQPPARRQIFVFAAAVILAAPAFWAGFIGGKMMWLVPGLAVILLSRLLIPTRPAGEVAA